MVPHGIVPSNGRIGCPETYMPTPNRPPPTGQQQQPTPFPSAYACPYPPFPSIATEGKLDYRFPDFLCWSSSPNRLNADRRKNLPKYPTLFLWRGQTNLLASCRRSLLQEEDESIAK
jgi:hypothetical protein